jgi:uncharacterized membrane protein YczE
MPASRTAPLLRRWALLLAGFVGWGLAVSLMIRSGLGLGPWDAFHVGLHRLLGIGVGTASIAAGALIVLGSLPLGVRPGVGTLANMVLIGASIDAILPRLPAAPGPAWGLAYHLAGIGLAGWFTGMYIAAHLGKGPRDGLVLALADRSGWPVRRVRTVVEVAVLGLGWALGGTLGVGTVLYALTIGPSMQWGLRRWGVLPAATAAPEASPIPRAA